MAFGQTKEPRHVILTWGDFAKFIFYGILIGITIDRIIHYYQTQILNFLITFHLTYPYVILIELGFIGIIVWDKYRTHKKHKKEREVKMKKWEFEQHSKTYS